ncbi:2-amino-4-hydroxy-6-hydroxymethyldihydropteridine diphosphokinase [Parabacteroides pacaensis]|uniref:2-amino-4-hydroxy-6- hydroxymethyldihydropteridine diphosphokinase n=1 Tax=Parabacteroides pacaensis TaxID=2086575 RepID=UPI000D10D01D|nr:2-amino-4-hydroxy-6-hydroxymethyldihydropteridine diphosphokinase [Parabacteroides pacaensis]
MAVVYLSLGSNLGDTKKNITTAVALLAERVGVISALSSLYETAPWGFISKNSFLNCAIEMNTDFSPWELLHITQQVEREMGRTQKSDGEYHDRIIDIDILMYANEIIETPELTLPHPLMHRRTFVLDPLEEIAPDLFHPVLHKTIRTLYLEIHN